MDLKNGQSRALTSAPELVTGSLTLAPDEREFAYLAGRSLYTSRLNGGHTREVYRLEEGFNFGTGFSLSDDGLVSVLVEEKPGTSRLRLITMRAGSAATLVESSDSISDPQPRPKRAGVMYKKGGELWVVDYDATQNRKLHIAPGALATALWSEDGQNHRLPEHPGRPEKTEQHPRVYSRYKRGPVDFLHYRVRHFQSQQRYQRIRWRERQ